MNAQDAPLASWRLQEVTGDRRFDAGRRWLPAALSGADRIACLTPGERLKLTHVEMGAYAHLFGCLEGFVEAEHTAVFHEVLARADAAIGFPIGRLPEGRHLGSLMLGKHRGAVLLLSMAAEWQVQQHYLACLQEDAALDPFARHVFKSHWLEESWHVRPDHLETLRVFQSLTAAGVDDAIDDFIDLLIGVEGLLHIQARLDLESLLRYLRRRPGRADQQEILTAVLAAKRYTFVESGLAHASFRELLGMVATPAQQQRVRQGLGTALATAA
jgi:hypothetical protein